MKKELTITERNKKEAVNAVTKLKNNKVDEIIHNQVSYSLSLYVSSFFAENFIHYITPQAKMDCISEVTNNMNDALLSDEMESILYVLSKWKKALLEDKVGAMLEAIKYI